MCASDEDDAPQVWTRERDGFEIRVVSEPPECACGCLGNDDDDPYTGDEPCRCVHPEDPCYADHYAGHCGCACQDCCDCECILLARITVPDEGDEPGVDHRVRRFIRPLLMRDPQARIEAQARMAAAAQARTAKKTSRKKTSRSSGSGDRARTQEES
jgi:hypothetical protein